MPARVARSSSLPKAILLATLGLTGCTMIVGKQLSTKPEEESGAGGHGGGADAGSEPTPTATTSAATTATTSATTGGATCPLGFGDCDGQLANGCEARFAEDPENCGACHTRCQGPQKCKNASCS